MVSREKKWEQLGEERKEPEEEDSLGAGTASSPNTWKIFKGERERKLRILTDPLNILLTGLEEERTRAGQPAFPLEGAGPGLLCTMGRWQRRGQASVLTLNSSEYNTLAKHVDPVSVSESVSYQHFSSLDME